MKTITLDDVERISIKLAQAHLGGTQPIPAFHTRYPDRLESCLAIPFQEFGGYSPYPTLIKKASILFYLMNKNHPFQNGNKRIALTTLLTFLFFNDKWLEVSARYLYVFAIQIASSDAILKDEMVKLCEGYIIKHMVAIKEDGDHKKDNDHKRATNKSRDTILNT